jgi:hypothetical protein
MPSQEPGYVYILTNPSFREDWVKIGKSSRPVNVRSKELDNTAVPLPFEIYASLKTVKYHEVERMIHENIDTISNLRIRKNREFFNLSPDKALRILEIVAACFDDAKITVYGRDTEDERPFTSQPAVSASRPISVTSPKRTRFQFSMIGLKPGEVLTFTPARLDVIIESDHTIQYQGKTYTLSGFTREFMPADKRVSSGAYQGPKYFTYQGVTLDDLRTQSEQNDERIQLSRET